MPLYEYYCSDCRSNFELLVNHQHADEIVCSQCHSEKVRRLLSTFAFSGKFGNGSSSSYEDFDSSSDSSCGCGGGGCGCH